MWSAIKTEAIVLTSAAFREADNRYTALTSEHGKIEFIGRGARKGKAKLAAHLEPFAVIDLEIIKGRKTTTVISVERKEWFREISSNLEKRIIAQASLHLLERYTFTEEADALLYDELKNWLTFLNSDTVVKPTRQIFLLGGFLLRSLHHLGYNVQLTECVNCKSSILPLSFRWHAAKGGLVCSDCSQRDPQEWFAARVLEEEAVKLLRFARDTTYADLLRPALRGEDIEQFSKLVQDIIYFHIPHYHPQPYWEGVLVD